MHNMNNLKKLNILLTVSYIMILSHKSAKSHTLIQNITSVTVRKTHKTEI